jgi:hypothetical protein
MATRTAGPAAGSGALAAGCAVGTALPYAHPPPHLHSCHLVLGMLCIPYMPYMPYTVHAHTYLVPPAHVTLPTDAGAHAAVSRVICDPRYCTLFLVVACGPQLSRPAPSQMLERTQPVVRRLLGEGVDLSPWCIPPGYDPGL